MSNRDAPQGITHKRRWGLTCQRSFSNSIDYVFELEHELSLSIAVDVDPRVDNIDDLFVQICQA